jgi:hypothetical protein
VPTSTSPKALKILKSTDPLSGVNSWYYVEYRTATGFDSFIASILNTNIMNGVIIHTGTDGNGNSSKLLDMTPNSSIYFSYDWNDPALAVGQSYTDPDAGVTITPMVVDGTTASVNVTFGSGAPPPPPLPASVDATPPTVTLTNPTNGAAVARNKSITMAATATDNLAVTRVEFSVNNKLICSDTSSPYTCSWKVPASRNATYLIKASAYDAAGNTSSATNTVTAK